MNGHACMHSPFAHALKHNFKLYFFCFILLLLLFVKDVKAPSACVSWHEYVHSVNLQATTLDLRPIHTILAVGEDCPQ